MNLINEQLASIRRQKALFKQRINETNDNDEKLILAERICNLTIEENRLLSELGVKV